MSTSPPTDARRLDVAGERAGYLVLLEGGCLGSPAAFLAAVEACGGQASGEARGRVLPLLREWAGACERGQAGWEQLASSLRQPLLEGDGALLDELMRLGAAPRLSEAA